MKWFLCVSIVLFSFVNICAQEQTTLRLTPEQFEGLFLKQNLRLIAGQMDIDLADAAVMQAKLWENPELTVSSVNLWSTDKQRDGENERIPPLFGSFAKNTQFSVELSQLIQTANKRAKLVNREKAAKEMAKEEFGELLRSLKTELRKTIHETCYIQEYIQVLNRQTESLGQLVDTYRNQVREGNIARSELLRLQSSLLEVENEMNELRFALSENQKMLKAFIHAEPFVCIEFEIRKTRPVTPDKIPLSMLLDKGTDNRSDIRHRRLTTYYYEKSWAYEKSSRVPDLTIHAAYDRYGGVWKDFIGFGFSINLPLLNRNQGHIKAARLLSDQSRYMEQQQEMFARNEIVQAYDNYIQTYSFYTKINEDDFLSELDRMFDIYAQNLLNKNISMLEYIDFTDTFRSNKQIVLESEKNVRIRFEELQFVTATELTER